MRWLTAPQSNPTRPFAAASCAWLIVAHDVDEEFYANCLLNCMETEAHTDFVQDGLKQRLPFRTVWDAFVRTFSHGLDANWRTLLAFQELRQRNGESAQDYAELLPGGLSKVGVSTSDRACADPASQASAHPTVLKLVFGLHEPLRNQLYDTRKQQRHFLSNQSTKGKHNRFEQPIRATQFARARALKGSQLGSRSRPTRGVRSGRALP